MAVLIVFFTDAARHYSLVSGKVTPLGDNQSGIPSGSSVAIEGTPNQNGTFDLRDPDGFVGKPTAYITSSTASPGKFSQNKWVVGDQGEGDGKFTYEGRYKENGHYFFVFERGDQAIVYSQTANPLSKSAGGDFEDNYSDLPMCFMAGTEIATPTGMCLVENLGIGDPVLTASGEVMAVKWIGRRSYYPRVSRDPRIEPVCIRAGALGNGLPHSDLTVTADQGLSE